MNFPTFGTVCKSDEDDLTKIVPKLKKSEHKIKLLALGKSIKYSFTQYFDKQKLCFNWKALGTSALDFESYVILPPSKLEYNFILNITTKNEARFMQ